MSKYLIKQSLFQTKFQIEMGRSVWKQNIIHYELKSKINGLTNHTRLQLHEREKGRISTMQQLNK